VSGGGSFEPSRPGREPGALAPPPAAPPRRPRVLGWLTLSLLLAPLVALIVALTALWQGLHTEAGTRWWLTRISEHVPGLQLTAPRGALLGADADFSLERLRLKAGSSLVTIDALRLAGLRTHGWQWRAPYLQLQAATLQARRIDVVTAANAAPSPPAAAPQSLRLPIGLRIDALRIDALALAALPAPVEAIAARVELGSERHRLAELSARWRGLRAEGRAEVETGGELALDARFALRADAESATSTLPAWTRDLSIEAQAQGPLARFDAQAAIDLRDQRLDARAQVTPFDALPVSQLDARFAKLDLAALGDALALGTPLPTTVLDGSLGLQLNRDAPLALRAEIRNAEPGRWDRRRLPLAEVDLQARGSGTAWQVERGQFRLAGDGARAAGSLEASGRIDRAAADLELRLRDVLLQALDGRAPPLRLGGPVRLRHEPPAGGDGLGVVRLDGELEGTQAAVVDAKAPRGAAKAATSGKTVQATLAASADLPASRFVVDKLQARSGNARLDGSGRVERSGSQWQAKAELALADFDPALWWPGDPAAAWRRAGNRLQGRATLDASLPATLPASDTTAWLAALKGRLDARFDDNLLAGQPLGLRAQAEADGRGALRGDADAVAVGNRARAEFALNVATAIATDERLKLDIDAPDLDKLAPIAQAFGLGRVGGKARLQANAEGPLGAWLAGRAATSTAASQTALRSRGTATLQALQFGTTTLANADGRWDLTLPGRAAASAGSRLDAQAELRELRTAGVQLPQAVLSLAGTLASHQARVQATIEQRPATAPGKSGDAQRTGERTLPSGAPALGRLALDFDLDGTWQAANAADASLWRARVKQLSLAPVAASGNAAAKAKPATPLFAAQGLDLELGLGAAGSRFKLAPGRADVLGAALRWSRAEWSRAPPAANATSGPPDRLDVDAEIEPFAVAALLQRLQPDFGWTGDLLVGARATVRSEPSATARVELTRVSGDLSVQEFDFVQSLGLSELRLDLNVAGGVWTATQVVAGDTLGRVAGAQTVRNAGGALWPAADAPVEGAIRLQVDNLSTWGAWVPAGWRLGGALDGVLTIAGRFGAPELVGTLDGRQLAVRNALEGVAWSDGELKARFEGETARLDTLSFKAGDGRLAATGDARLGAAAQTRLRVTAERATVLGRVDRRVVATGEARLTLDAQALAVDGELRADEGLVDISRGDAPKLGDDVRVRRAGAPAPDTADTAPAAAPATPRDVNLRLAIDLGENFRLRGRGIDTRLEGKLQLTSPKGKLAATGEIRTERGTYEAYGQKLSIERGVITFVNDIANPRLDIEAVRANTDTRVGVLVSGSAQAPRVRLFSEPEMPSTDKLALLVTGRSYDSLGGTETLLLQQAAMALLAGDGSETSRFDVARLLQLDQLSVRQSDGTVRDTVVTLGKQISDRVYVGYERGMNAAAGNWQLIYRIARRFTLRAQSGDDPAVDLIWVFRWN